MLRFLTAGESHGRYLTAIIEGLPAGLEIDLEDINQHLSRRQHGHGRGGRMKIEHDRVEITSGLRHGKTMGSPLCLMIENRDYTHWQEIMSVYPDDFTSEKNVTKPRPGHADLPGGLKYNHKDLRNILERASARETAIRVAVGAVAMALLGSFAIEVHSFVLSIGEAIIEEIPPVSPDLWQRAASSPVFCPDAETEKRMMAAIDAAKSQGDSLGGTFRIIVQNLPPGIGSHVHWDRRLDANLAHGLMSIPGVKGVEIGLGFPSAFQFGSQVHDEIFYKNKFYRKTNNAGGIEGGISNGEDIVLTCAMKPIPTLYKPLRSVDLQTKKPFTAEIERSDTCAVPAASVVGEAMAAIVIATAFLEKFGGDSMDEVKRNFQGYLSYLQGG